MKHRRLSDGSDGYSCAVALNTRSRTITLMGDICVDMYNKLVDALGKLCHSTGPIEIKINSGGGDLAQALAMYDEIRTLDKIHVTTIGVGECCSGAAVLLQAGDTRAAYQHCQIMIHKGSFELPEEYADENYSTVDHYKKMDKLHQKIFEEASIGKIGTARYFTAEEALAKNIIDKVIS